MGHQQYGHCTRCGFAIGRLDYETGGICALCRADRQRVSRELAAVATLAKIEDHCRQHNHSGVNLGYHTACYDVLKIIDANRERGAHGRANEDDEAEARAAGPAADRSDAGRDTPHDEDFQGAAS